MIRYSPQPVVWCGLVSLVLTGCMTGMDADAMQRPQRPVELDRLNMLVGTWESTADAKIAGSDEVQKGRGTTTANWECDGWCLVERGQYDMGSMGKLSGVSVWTWDSKAKVYRTFWSDSYGDTDVGTARFDEKTKTFHLKSKSHGVMGTSRSAGSIKVGDDKTMEWDFSERVGPFGMIKALEMNGVSKKK